MVTTMKGTVELCLAALLLAAAPLRAPAGATQSRNPSECGDGDASRPCDCESDGDSVGDGCIKVTLGMGRTTPWTGSRRLALKVFADDRSPLVFTPGTLHAVAGWTFMRLGPSATADGRGNVSRTEYDGFGRRSATIDAAGNATRYGYDADGSLVAVTNALGGVTVYGYDLRGNRIYEGGATYPVRREYDVFGNMTSMATYRDGASGSGDVTRWAYDAATGAMTNKTYADGRGPSYGYDANGRLARRTWARGMTTDYAYDGWGNLTNTAYSDGTPSVALRYDAMGRLAEARDAAGATAFAYDAFGSVTNETRNGESILRAYDRFGRLAALDGTAYGYNGGSGRLASVVDGTNRFACAYLSGTEFVSGWSCGEFAHTTAYEPKRDLVAAVTNRFGDSVVSSFGYENDAAGRRTAIRRGGSAFGDLAGAADAYGYNARSEVVSARRTLGGNPLPDREETFAYDPIGNRTESSVAGTNTAYAANALNQYARVETGGDAFEPQYDADGNQTLVRTPTGVWAIEWNAENRPVRWTCGDKVLLMDYDRMGRRVRYVETTGGVTNRVATFLYDGYLCIARTADGITDRFLWNPAETVATRPLAMVADGTAYLYAHDANKNVSEVVNARTGETAAHYDYSAFGRTLVAAGPLAHRNPFRFSSEYVDDATGLTYYNYRHYDPVHGCWLSRDPLNEKGGRNLYGIGGNNLIGNSDLLGKIVSPLSDEEIKVCKTRLDKAKSVALKHLNENNSCKCAFKNSTLCKENAANRLRSIKIEIDNTSDICLKEEVYGYTYDSDGRWKIYVCPRTCRWGYLCLAETLLHELFHECKPGIDDDDGTGETFDVEKKCGLGDSCG